MGSGHVTRTSSSGFIKKSYPTTFLILFGLFITMIFIAISAGRYGISVNDVVKILFSKILPIPKTWDNTMENVVFNLRLPRITAAIIVGGVLSLSGAAYQSIFKNPLVSPDLLGVSSGASVGAALAILLNANMMYIQIGAFLGGILAVFITTLIPKLLRNKAAIMLVLAGIIVGGLMSSLLGILKYAADTDTKLAEITYWQMGSLAKVSKANIIQILPAVGISAITLIAMRWKMNILSLGENEARMLGINISKTRILVIIFSTILTASSVCVSGTIGWVGLVVPHLGRMLVGPDNTKLIPVSVLLGSVFMLFIDTLARTLTKAEIPLSILTGLIGAPFYFWMLIKQRMNLQ